MTPSPPETWRPVPIAPYDTCYEVSDLGRIRSLDRIVRNGPGYRKVRGRILPHARYSVWLSASENDTGRIIRGFAVAGLVLRAFRPDLEPPTEDRPNVRHLNGDRTDNRLSNLAWVRQEEPEHRGQPEIAPSTCRCQRQSAIGRRDPSTPRKDARCCRTT